MCGNGFHTGCDEEVCFQHNVPGWGANHGSSSAAQAAADIDSTTDITAADVVQQETGRQASKQAGERSQLSHLDQVYGLVEPETKLALQQLLHAAWIGDESVSSADLAIQNAAAAGVVPNLLSVPNLLLRRAVPMNSLGPSVPSAQLLQDAAVAYVMEPDLGFFRHLQHAVAASRAKLQTGTNIDMELKNSSANLVKFDPHMALDVQTAVEVLSVTSKPVRAKFAYIFKPLKYVR